MPTPVRSPHRQKAIRYLRGLGPGADTHETIKSLAKRLFENRGWKFWDVDKSHERLHCCDLLMTLEGAEGTFLEGIQVKTGAFATAGEVAADLAHPTSKALTFRHRRDDRLIRLSRYYLLCTGEITPSAWLGIDEEIVRHPANLDRVEVWSLEKLVDQLADSAPHLLEPLELEVYERKARDHEGRGEGIFAAHYWYRAFRWQLERLSTSEDLAAARRSIDSAVKALRTDGRKQSHYFRSLEAYYQHWALAVSEAAGLGVEPIPQPIDAAASERIRSALQNTPAAHSAILFDLDSVHFQLSLLGERQAVDYASLALLGLTRLLLRIGFSPTDPSVARRLDCIRREAATTDDRTIDGLCSLCTGFASSCFALARDTELEPAVRWLRSLRDFRYAYNGSSYTDGGPTEHALHYAAVALTGILDYSGETAEVHDSLAVFFSNNEVDQRSFPSSWMRYRSQERSEICRYIFAGFLRFLLVGVELSTEQIRFLRPVLENLISVFRNDADNPESPWRQYAARENLGSFALGIAIDAEGASEFAEQVLGVGRRRSAEIIRSRSRGRAELLDSSTERTTIFVEGVLQYWETVLFLEESGKNRLA